MIKKYRESFVKTMMVFITISLATILILVNFFNYIQIRQRSIDRINFIMEYDDTQEKNWNHKGSRYFDLSYFTVTINQGNYEINASRSSTMTNEDAITYANDVLKLEDKEDIYNGYRYCVSEKNGMPFIGFVNVQPQIESMNVFFFTSVGITILATLTLYAIVVYASKKALLPMEEGIRLQKQFITDAGHEIKTPLAVISANNEVLEMEIGENEWIKSNKNQIERLNTLVKQLLLLSKMEESHYEFTTLNVSECLQETIETFHPLMNAKHIQLDYQIEDNMIVRADVTSFQNLFNVLLDNALKYVQDPYQIKITCKKTMKGCVIEFFNTCNSVEHIELLFERFYRGDQSHSSTIEGQGIGLSIARTIVETHNGKISASNTGQGFLIRIEL